MPVVISQRYPLGRFHATRWNQNPFEDPHGEWPPSPWRLLRALAARWFQYSRETGDRNEAVRDELLQTLASSVPSYRLPELTWRGKALRQYVPTAVEWTDKSKAKPAVKKPQRTLVEDHFRAVAPDEPIYWLWESASLNKTQETLLRHLLDRMLYFGRAESHCRLELLDRLPDGCEPNCRLSPKQGRGCPVLVPRPDVNLDIHLLLAPTDDERMARRRIPAGTMWYYAELPRKLFIQHSPSAMTCYPSDLTSIQFAIGGRVVPTRERWVKLTERFRGRVLRRRAQQVAQRREAAYGDLTADQRENLSLIAGKDGNGHPLDSHRHAYFAVWPDENGQASRLICFRNSSFTPDEVQAILAASEQPITWESGSDGWQVRLVPLPFDTVLPSRLIGPSTSWRSVSAFVPPRARRRFRRHGRLRPGERPSRLVSKFLQKCGFPEPVSVVPSSDPVDSEWVYIHATLAERRRLRDQGMRPVRLGYHFQIEFSKPVSGPLCIGDSSHFGLGLFAAVEW